MLRRAGDRAAPGSDLGTARFETFLRRLFSVKGIVAPAIDPKISAGIELLTPPWELGETALLAGWRGFEAFADVPAGGAGLFGMMELRNVGTGVIVVVEKFKLYETGAAFQVTAGIRDSRPAGSAAVTAIGAVDSRYGSIASVTSIPSATPFAGSNVTAIGLIPAAYYRNANQADPEIRGPWMLGPSNATATFQILALTANLRIAVGVRWWERAIEPSEIVAR